MPPRSTVRRIAPCLLATLLVLAPAPSARGGFVPIPLPDAAYQSSTTRFDLPTSGPPVSSLTAGDQTITLSSPMGPSQFSVWGTLPFVESTSPPSLGFGVFGASSRVLTFSQPLSTFGLEMQSNNPTFFFPYSLTAEFFHDATLVGSIRRDIRAPGGARLFAATDVEEPFTSVRLSAESAAGGFLIADVRATAVPEPSGLGLLLCGMAGAAGYAWRRGARGPGG